MPGYSLEQIANIMGGQLYGNPHFRVSKLNIDSRKVVDVNETVFVALRGENHDGHKFVEELIAKGVCCFVVDKIYPLPKAETEVSFIVVDNSLDALHRLAGMHRQYIHYPILGITGSNGKTIVKEWIVQLAGNDFHLIRSPRSFNSQVGVPLSLWLLEENAQLGILEAGISQKGEMSRLEQMIHPEMGLFTNIGQAHQENFSTEDEKLQEKLNLFENAQSICYCSDHLIVDQAILARFPQKKLVTWGRNAGATLQIVTTVTEEAGIRVAFRWESQMYSAFVPFIDSASLENAMHALLFLLNFGLEPEKILSRMAHLRPVAMRLEQKEGINGCLLINDAYNSDITSLEVALDFLNQQARRNEMSRTLILSDILQSGMTQVDLYRRVAQLMKEKGVDQLIGIGPEISRHADVFGASSEFFASAEELFASGLLAQMKNEVILLKGSRDFSFERISDRLEQKRHQTVMEINLNALSYNLNYFRSLLKPDTKVLAMVKAFSYGSGSFEIAGLLQHQKVDYLGVAFADEGIELRKAGITLPIIVMNPERRSFPMMLEYNLEPEIYSFRVLDEFAEVAASEGVTNVAVHIKIDTGMLRLGFLPSEVEELTSRLQANRHLSVKSLFSHLAGSEDSSHDAFTLQQIQEFEMCANAISIGIGYPFMKHVLNSAGIERFPQSQFDMVRLGIGLYGISTVKGRTQNVATLKSFVSQIKTVDAGSTVGYGRKGKLAGFGCIAVVPVGYADGLDRRLSNGVGKVMINAQVAPIVGNVCMDMCMVDVTGLNVNEGDEVIIFGDELPLWDMAEAINTIPYEVLTGISRRVTRVYFQE
jgi:alanine racemase